MLIQTRACARAALIGNPSDGYFGKTISFAFDNFSATVTLWESPEIVLLPSRRDDSVFPDIDALAEDVKLFGYYGGIRLLKAAIKTFHDHTRKNGIKLDDRKFTIRYQTDIPNLVGLSGSSAIITATYRALMAFYGVHIPKPELANIIRETEQTELGITAGLQDRVIQVYEGLVYMDFDKTLIEKQGYGLYENLDPTLLPPVYIAYRTDLSEMSGVFHNNIKARFNAGEKLVVDAMKFWAEITDQARAALESGDAATLSRLMDANFDKRASLYQLSEGNLRMVKAARACGVSAKFTGSGGAIIGVYEDEAQFKRLKSELAKISVEVIKPHIVG
ncbi:MAG: GHMP kinase [Kiritimatiellaeota bacterium]|nr:GHMP kinase [Kiritimatiellota bacterium]